MTSVASTSPGPGTEPANGLEAVFLGSRAALLGFLRSHGAGDAAEDLLQELWIKIGKAPPGPVAQPLAYLYRAANNLMLDRYRSARQAAKRDHAWSDEVDVVAEPAAERALIAREQLQQARAVLDGVGERAAAVFRRHRLDGIPQRDLASEFGISLTTVESDLRRAYRAMIELRQRLDDN
ncbi:RNA polymerase sigma factor [Sphingosinicellaceae bacterium]|nr:RNA polymerase sigma factor [Sphingosinicellaceae bacterium]